jgi:hypothetical protein
MPTNPSPTPPVPLLGPGNCDADEPTSQSTLDCGPSTNLRGTEATGVAIACVSAWREEAPVVRDHPKWSPAPRSRTRRAASGWRRGGDCHLPPRVSFLPVPQSFPPLHSVSPALTASWHRLCLSGFRPRCDPATTGWVYHSGERSVTARRQEPPGSRLPVARYRPGAE